MQKNSRGLSALSLAAFAFLLGEAFYDTFSLGLNWRLIIRLIISIVGFIVSIYVLYSSSKS